MNPRFEYATQACISANSEDPNRIDVDGTPRPRELVRMEQLVRWVQKLEPEASEALRLAAHCQHLRRWEIPRERYPEGREGYLEWRAQLSKFHAASASTILEQAGYDSIMIEQVRRLNLKRGLFTNPDTRTLEDALCLAFLEHEFDEFATRFDDEKLVNILRKTWKKMSPRGHAAALSLPASPRLRSLLDRALADEQ